jgi:hypothetical protein
MRVARIWCIYDEIEASVFKFPLTGLIKADPGVPRTIGFAVRFMQTPFIAHARLEDEAY